MAGLAADAACFSAFEHHGARRSVGQRRVGVALGRGATASASGGANPTGDAR
jgi:hypothetical protein